MKKIKFLLMAILAVGLSGCGGNRTTEPDITIYSITTKLINLDGEVLSENEIEYEDSTIEMVPLLETVHEMIFEETDFGPMLVAIDDLDARAGDTYYIALYEDDNYAMTGIHDMNVVDGKLVSFILTDWSL